MKKVFLFIIALATMTLAQAANTEVARLTLTGQGSASSSYVTLRVDPTVLAAETGSYFQNTDLPENVNIYVKVGSDKFSSFKLNEIVNLPIAIVTNRTAASNQHYTITFNVPTLTEGLKLKDLRTGTVTDIVNAGTYEFDVNSTTDPGYVEGTNFVIADRFVINFDAGFDVCFIDNVLQIKENPYLDDIVVKDANGDHVTGSPFTATPAPQNISLDALDAGNYTVEFGGGAKSFVVVVKH